VEKADHVVSVARRLKFTGLIGRGDASLSFLGQGYDSAREVGGEDAIIVERGAALSAADTTGILLGRGLADNLGAKVGDTVVLLVNKRGGTLDGLDAQVRGVFSTQTKAYDDVAVHLPFALANDILQARGAHAWVVYLDETRNTQATVGTLRQQLSRDLEVVPWYEAADFYNKTVRLFSRQVLVMKLIIALVVIFSISNTMMMNVLERTTEIATSMALGLRRARVLSRFLVEGLLIGLAGGLAGVALGYALGAAISAIGIPMPPPPGMARGFVGEILVTPGLASDALLLAGVTALVASVYPAWKASRMVIAEALRQGR
jgi:putative ABC transport system permease protein